VGVGEGEGVCGGSAPCLTNPLGGGVVSYFVADSALHYLLRPCLRTTSYKLQAKFRPNPLRIVHCASLYRKPQSNAAPHNGQQALLSIPIPVVHSPI
jgi:hypothetical protein